MDYMPEPFIDHQPLRQQCTNDMDTFAALASRQIDTTTKMRRYFLGAVGLLVVGMLGLGAISKAALVLSAVAGFMAIWATIVREKYDTLLHVVGLHDRIRPMYSGEDWLAYHLAQRVEAEAQAAIAAEEAVRAAVEAATVVGANDGVRH